ncbi:cytosine deaminase [Kitasatospora sp. MAA4]|uniref:hydrolase n=1 Tax=Kitasatospora sp. MAA4 TaxID=3035093 RepID=UPI00247317A3|nr:hydrolase [Kitasatospora sp. MAA4]MDH6136524.1 cytosine deaminase [Kitasatospora sp. MAA4]
MSADSAPTDGPQPGSPGPGPLGGNPLGHGPVLLLTGARLADGRVVDVRISGDRIQAVGTVGSLGPLPQAALPPTASPGGPAVVATGARIDLAGYLLLPAPAEPHAHHDTAFSAALPPPTALPGIGPTGSPVPSGPPRLVRPPAQESPAELIRRITEASLTSLGYGATAQRTHVRIGDVHGLRRLEAVLTARQALRGLAELQAVAVPRLLTGAAGADGRAALREALKLGADAVGGCPELDPDPAGYVQVLVEAALEFDCPVDLHTRGAEPAKLARTVAALAPLRPRVTLGPCDALAEGGAAALRAAGMRVVCLPQSGSCCGVEGRPEGLRPTLVRELAAAQVPLAAGSGALRDAANPVGRADPLEAAYLLAGSGALSTAAAYEAVSNQARLLMGLAPVRVDAGFPAELLAVRGDSLAGALSGGHSRLVVHSGRIVSRTSAVREFADTVALALPRQSGPH